MEGKQATASSLAFPLGSVRGNVGWDGGTPGAGAEDSAASIWNCPIGCEVCGSREGLPSGIGLVPRILK